MRHKAKTPEEYLNQLSPDRKQAVAKLRNTILEHLPEGFEETMSYGMIGYVVPHSKYPAGYHSDPERPLPFMNIASQKNHIALYHMGLYTDENLRRWFKKEYAKRSSTRLDMGKSCIRFKQRGEIPFNLIGELVEKMSPDEWIGIYEGNVQR